MAQRSTATQGMSRYQSNRNERLLKSLQGSKNGSLTILIQDTRLWECYPYARVTISLF